MLQADFQDSGFLPLSLEYFICNKKYVPIIDGMARLIIHKLLDAASIPMLFNENIPMKKRAREPRIPISAIGTPGILKRKT